MDSVYLELTLDDEDNLFFVSEALYDLAVTAEDQELARKLHLIAIGIAQVMVTAHERRNERLGEVSF